MSITLISPLVHLFNLIISFHIYNLAIYIVFYIVLSPNILRFRSFFNFWKSIESMNLLNCFEVLRYWDIFRHRHLICVCIYLISSFFLSFFFLSFFLSFFTKSHWYSMWSTDSMCGVCVCVCMCVCPRYYVKIE